MLETLFYWGKYPPTATRQTQEFSNITAVSDQLHNNNQTKASIIDPPNETKP